MIALLLCLGESRAVAATQGAAAGLTLQGGQASLQVDSETGVITRLEDQASGIVLEPPRALAESFRLILLQPDKARATIMGKDQKPSRFERDEGRLSLHWDGPLRDTARVEHDISVRMDARAADGALQFTLHLENRTTNKVQEAWYPMVGGLTKFCSPGQPPDATLWVPTPSPSERPLTLPFGVAAYAYPGQMSMSFACLQSKTAGRTLYLSSQDGIARYKRYSFQELGGPDGAKDVFACIQHSPFTPAGGTFEGSPVVLRFVPGDWRAGGQVYRQWFKNAFGLTEPSECWIRRESFFLMTMFMLPEGTINFTFKDIPRWAKTAKDHGINAVQISGWQVGGHDNGYPDYSIDPRLGTWKELQDGIRACHRMGLKVYFFVNYEPVMLDSDWYKNELHKYREMAADGGLTWNAGWGMGTLWARMDHPKRMTWADPAFPQFRKLIVDQFARLAWIGADGVHVDKVFPAALEYNPDTPLSADTSTWEGAILLTREVMAACRKYRPDWAMSFECNWDRLLQFTGSTWWVGNQPITRRVFPEHVETLGLYDAYDYLGVNNAVRNGHQVMVAPLSFCRSLDWAPFRGLADYIKEVKRIRDSLQETVFYGEVLGQTGVKFMEVLPSGIEYNVFRNRDTGRRVCVFSNSRLTPAKVAFTGFEQPSSAEAQLQTPFKNSRRLRLPAIIEVPAERIVFVEENGGAQ
jgi:hypothetical protein